MPVAERTAQIVGAVHPPPKPPLPPPLPAVAGTSLVEYGARRYLVVAGVMLAAPWLTNLAISDMAAI